MCSTLFKALWFHSKTLEEVFPIDVHEAHHLQRVLRATPGRSLVAFDGLGNTRLGKLLVQDSKAYFQAIEPVQQQPRMKPFLSLIMILPNESATFEIILKKACELGLYAIYTALGDHTEKHRWTSPVWTRKQTRWQQILVESCKQAKNPYLPQLYPPTTLEKLPWERFKGKAIYGSLLASENNPFINAPKTDSVADEMTFEKDNTRVGVVGPEGGFSNAEESFLRSVALPVRLGPYVQRVETAVVSLINTLANKDF